MNWALSVRRAVRERIRGRRLRILHAMKRALSVRLPAKGIRDWTGRIFRAMWNALSVNQTVKGRQRGRARRILHATLSANRRSVVFLHNSYYHFYYLAQALRRRGWDALTVSLEDPNGPNANYYHGEDVNLFSPDPVRFHSNIERFFAEAIERFSLLHFAGDSMMSFFPENWASDEPWDMVEWRRRGLKIAYTISGCNSGVAQSSVMRWSASDGAIVCDKCVWQLRPDICNDAKNLAWGRKVDTYCDVIFTEGSPALDYQATAKCVREPTTICLDPAFWHPDLEVPDRLKIARDDEELFVYHSFGNYETRSANGRNIKGTGAVKAALERLQAENIRVRLIFVTNVKNTEARFLQVQADVIVDQLNYGRYGATAREGLMLGKPTICYINPYEPTLANVLSSIREVPLVSATERTIYEILKDLLLKPEERRRIGKASRQYALKWHSADACAERYERIYDRVIKGSVDEHTFRASARIGSSVARGMSCKL